MQILVHFGLLFQSNALSIPLSQSSLPCIIPSPQTPIEPKLVAALADKLAKTRFIVNIKKILNNAINFL